ncbi:MAG: 4-hydroxybenzoate octaprenyltransferase [Betaproteobacteria bacterium]|nr:4-hydroxybenzoate octaprenyltransferase [Betaproteobacteria bacterium]
MDAALLRRRIDAYERLIRLDKPEGALLLLWPTLWAVWLAGDGRPPAEVVVIFIAGVFLMRSAGCALNDYADRHFDPMVERTRNRPLAAGEIAPKEALAVAAVLAAVAFCFALFLNGFAIALSVVALAVAASYPYTKRWFALPQLHLGVAFGFGIPMAYAALRGELPWECWALLAANVCYSFAYDTEYAMVDRDDDRRIGIRTSALALGRWDVAGVMTAYAGMLAILSGVGIGMRLGWPFFAGLAVAAALMLYHYRLIRDRTREGCFRAFRHNNWVGAAILAGLVGSFHA